MACGDDFSTFSDDPAEGGSGGAGNAAGGAGGSTSSTGDGGSGPMCVDFGDACTACERQACEDTFCECYGNTDCGLYAACTFECEAGDYECYQVCNTQHPAGITDAVLLNDCAADACPTECEGYPLIALTDCERCTYESCESQMNTCLANPDCTDLVFCLQDCGVDMACQNGCYAEFPGGISDATPVGTCAQTNCQSACYGG
jgi:hypothetical protein